jgi:hypothetical protein
MSTLTLSEDCFCVSASQEPKHPEVTLMVILRVGVRMTDSLSPEDTELWAAIQQAKDDMFVRPDQPFEF